MRLHPPSLILGVLLGGGCTALWVWLRAPEPPGRTAGYSPLPPPEKSPPDATPADDLPPPSAAPPLDATELRVLLAMAGAPDGRTVTLVLDRGHFDAGGWVSEAVGDDRLLDPAAPVIVGGGSLARASARLPFGDGVAVVARDGCAPAQVPFHVGALDTVVLPYLACDAPLPDPLPATLAEQVHSLGLWPELPEQVDGALAWVTASEAAALCAWLGSRLPTEQTTLPRAPPTSPSPPQAWWLADGSIGGHGRIDRAVPLNARTGEIGVRCLLAPR